MERKQKYSVEAFYQSLFHPNVEGMGVMAKSAQDVLATLPERKADGVLNSERVGGSQ